MVAKQQPPLDKEKVLGNAVVSIQLGVQDYQMSVAAGGNPQRAISSARNLFAGVLLLFKYKLASLAASPEHAATLIYKSRNFKPQLGDNGVIEWHPELERNQTIDTNGLKSYFTSLGIETDWAVVRTLQICRNDLEHLHPTHPIEEIKKFLLDLFPLLRDFITNELGENPATLLPGTWDVMLQNHAFFTQNLENAQAMWRDIGVPEHTMQMFSTCQCPNCGSHLLQPNRDDIDAPFIYSDSEFRYSCIACGHSDSFTELFTEEVRLAKEDPFSDEPVVIECDACGHATFDLEEGHCQLCEYHREASRCEGCHFCLTPVEAEHSGKCDRCVEADHLMER